MPQMAMTYKYNIAYKKATVSRFFAFKGLRTFGGASGDLSSACA